MRFVFSPEHVGAAWKAANFSGDFGGLGPPLPPGCLAFVSQGAQERRFEFWAYGDDGREYRQTYQFDRGSPGVLWVPIQDGGPNGVQSINVTGKPVLVCHDHILKAFYADFKDRSLWRFNTGWRVQP